MAFNASQGFISGQPPLIVFTICLTAFGCTMIILAYVIGGRDVPNPDVKMDWNKFFQKISNLNLCPILSEKSTINKGSNLLSKAPQNSSAAHVVDESKSMSAVLSNVVDSAMSDPWKETTFTDVYVKAKFGLHGKLSSISSYNLKGIVRGKSLGLPGKYSKFLFNVSLSLHPLENKNCSSVKCSPLFEICISVSLPSEVIPHTKMPDICLLDILPSQEAVAITFSEEAILDPNDFSSMCIGLNYTSEASLTEMLSPRDRSIINLHLMHTSYFMFVMVMTLVCVSLVRGRMRQPKNYVALSKVPSVT